MPVADLAAPDSALFLWATFPQLPEALRLIEAWGFTYKSVAFVWLKKNKKADSWFYGLGFWTRGNAEICLLATKGHPKRQAANIHQFIISPIEAHSKKPDEARVKIISLMGDLPRVELFARQTPPGWAVTTQKLEQMRSVDIGAVAAESLPDVSGMTFDNALSRKERISRFLQTVKNPYCFCIGGVGVKIEFAESGPSLQDKLTDFLLRQRSGL